MNDTFIDIRGARLHLRRHGVGAPLLFLHGVQGMPDWLPALEGLARRFDVFAPDHPGFGGSDATDWIDDLGDLAFFYLDLLEAYDLRDVHLVGESLGGWIALEMAIRSTARIKSLTLAASAGIQVAGVPRGDMFMATAAELGRLLFADEKTAAAWAARWQETPALQETYDRNRHAAAKYTWQPRLYNPKLAKWLHRIDVPTQILWGDGDRLIPPAYAAAMKRQLDHASVTIIPACGHLISVERADLFTAAVTQFVERLER